MHALMLQRLATWGLRSLARMKAVLGVFPQTQFALAISIRRWSWHCRKRFAIDVKQISIGRLGTLDEISRCVVFLDFDDASFINGSTISANGGNFFI